MYKQGTISLLLEGCVLSLFLYFVYTANGVASRHPKMKLFKHIDVMAIVSFLNDREPSDFCCKAIINFLTKFGQLIANHEMEKSRDLIINTENDDT